MHLGLLLTLDTIQFCVQLTVVITNDTQYKKIMDLRGPAAQDLLNFLQAIYDSSFSIFY